ncbi:MAG: trimethylamine methyltransferase family protein, partial [Chloroflexota bacterium]
ALDDIDEVGVGGHHFGTARTQANFKTAFYDPVVTDRRAYEPWEAAGAPDALQRAHKLWPQLLEAYEQPPIDDNIVEALDAFVERRTRELAGVDLYQ